MGGRGALCAESGAGIFQTISRGTEMCRASRTVYTASQALGRYRIARGVAGAQHGAAEDRRIHHIDGSDPGRALWAADGSGDSRFAPAGGACGEPSATAAYRPDFAVARA